MRLAEAGREEPRRAAARVDGSRRDLQLDDGVVRDHAVAELRVVARLEQRAVARRLDRARVVERRVGDARAVRLAAGIGATSFTFAMFSPSLQLRGSLFGGMPGPSSASPGPVPPSSVWKTLPAESVSRSRLPERLGERRPARVRRERALAAR